MKSAKYIRQFVVIFFVSISILLNTAIIAPITLAEEKLSTTEMIDYKAEALVEDKEFEEDKVLVKYQGEEDIDIVELEPSQQNENGVKAKLKEILQDKKVEVVQPNYLYETTSWTDTATTSKPGDYNNSNHWYYTQEKLPELWKDLGCPSGTNCSGKSSVIVAVLDTGLAFEDFDDTSGITGANFAAVSEYSSINLYVNSAETADNGLDDDCNGYVDDVHGIDSYAPYEGTIDKDTCTGGTPDAVAAAYQKAGHPVDTYGHGTFVTGNIASATDNGAGSISPAFDVSIMPLAANDHFTRSFSTLALKDAVDYARVNGADILNMSLGGKGDDSIFRTALTNAYNAGVTLIAASGNTSISQGITATTVIYPAAYANVISVGAVDADNSRSSYSVYGNGVDLVAYVGDSGSSGGAAWQTSVTCYFSQNCSSANIGSGASTSFSIGTSFAAPQVSAAAALIKSKNSSYTPSNIYDIFINSVTDISSSGYDKPTGFGVLNFQDAMVTSPTNLRSVYRFWSPDNEAHFYTINTAEKNYIQNNYPTNIWTYEGVAFSAYTTKVVESKPVYRFWSPDNEAHFFTISSDEKDLIVNSYPENIWTYEGIAYYAYSGSFSGRKPLYRFWSPDNESHFFTISKEERDLVINSYPDNVWTYEGVAYYVK